MTEEKRRRRTCGGCRHFIRDVGARGTCAEHGHDVELAGEARCSECRGGHFAAADCFTELCPVGRGGFHAVRALPRLRRRASSAASRHRSRLQSLATHRRGAGRAHLPRGRSARERGRHRSRGALAARSVACVRHGVGAGQGARVALVALNNGCGCPSRAEVSRLTGVSAKTGAFECLMSRGLIHARPRGVCATSEGRVLVESWMGDKQKAATGAAFDSGTEAAEGARGA